MTVNVTMKVNGKSVTADVAASTTLVEFIREHLRLTGTHVGCNTAQCGACTVHVNGRAVKSCNMLAAQAAGADVTTIEGLAAANGDMHPMQAAFKQNHGLQCGYCTPGFVCSMAAEYYRRDRKPIVASEEHCAHGSDAGSVRLMFSGRCLELVV